MRVHQRVIAEERAGRSVRDDTTGIEDDGPRTGLRHESEIVCRNQASRAEPLKQADELTASTRVEPTRRFVEDDGLRLARQKTGETDSLLLATAQPMRQPRLESDKAHLRERIGDALEERVGSQPPLPRSKRHVLADRWAKELVVRILKEEPDVVARHLQGRMIQAFAEEADFAFAVAPARLGQNANQVKQKRRLARAVRSDERNALAFCHVKGDVLEGLCSIFEMKRQVQELDRVGHGPPRARMAA